MVLAAIIASAVLTAMSETMPGRCLRTCGVHMPKVDTAFRTRKLSARQGAVRRRVRASSLTDIRLNICCTEIKQAQSQRMCTLLCQMLESRLTDEHEELQCQQPPDEAVHAAADVRGAGAGHCAQHRSGLAIADTTIDMDEHSMQRNCRRAIAWRSDKRSLQQEPAYKIAEDHQRTANNQ